MKIRMIWHRIVGLLTNLAAAATAVILASGSAQGDSVTLYPATDGHVGPASTSYAKTFGATTFKCGAGASAGDYRAFLKFDLSSIPAGASISQPLRHARR